MREDVECAEDRPIADAQALEFFRHQAPGANLAPPEVVEHGRRAEELAIELEVAQIPGAGDQQRQGQGRGGQQREAAECRAVAPASRTRPARQPPPRSGRSAWLRRPGRSAAPAADCRRVSKPSRSMTSIRQASSAASKLISASLLTEALMKRNCGLKAVSDAASSATPARPAGQSAPPDRPPQPSPRPCRGRENGWRKERQR